MNLQKIKTHFAVFCQWPATFVTNLTQRDECAARWDKRGDAAHSGKDLDAAMGSKLHLRQIDAIYTRVFGEAGPAI